jgi:DNA helicase II / ATP-dependent DNA helicase PcrA
LSSFRLFDLNSEQYRAATHPGGPMLILAGAGTGKTRVLTARIAWLVAQEVDPSSILAVTFTNKAAKEMRERVAGAVSSEAAKQITLSTFHSLCVRLLRRHAPLLGFTEHFSIFDEGDQTGLIKKLAARIHDKESPLDPNLCKHLISKAKNLGLEAPDSAGTALGSLFSKYQEELRTLNAMDFDDLLLQARTLLRDHREAREEWRARYTHILVDEFQDTNRLQLELVSLLAGDDHPNICVVGDDDQSIYGWRGAEASNLLEFERHFPDPEVIKLEQNYRSTDVILKVANRLIKNNSRRRGKNLWSDQKEGESVRILSATDDKTEAEFIADEIQAAGPQSSEARPWTDFAILYRMNAQSRQFEEILRERRIPYRVVGGKSFFDRREVKDVVSYLAALLNPDDDNALLRVLSNPPRGIGAATLQLATEAGAREGKSLLSVLNAADHLDVSSSRTRNAIQRFTEDWGAYRIQLQTPGADAAEILKSILEECGYFEDLRKGCKSEEEADNRQENVRELLNALAGYCQRHQKEGPRGFLDGLVLEQEKEEEKAEEREGVTLITLHAAKGLEFSRVWLVGAEDGLLPHERSKAEGTVEEERRLLYVGITRARHRLTITHCATRRKFGSVMSCTPSPFLKELEGEGVESTSIEEILSTPMSEEEVLDGFARMRAMLQG